MKSTKKQRKINNFVGHNELVDSNKIVLLHIKEKDVFLRN